MRAWEGAALVVLVCGPLIWSVWSYQRKKLLQQIEDLMHAIAMTGDRLNDCRRLLDRAEERNQETKRDE